ncbi:hypothetical protein [Microbacterium gorillae]|uniref:hypothetical protein n=1 Tax=Microbacterium gorillae TaxID=1231063 RepID=UPI003D96599C
METLIAVASEGSPEQVTPFLVVSAIVMPLLWFALMFFDHRAKVRARRDEENPE